MNESLEVDADKHSFTSCFLDAVKRLSDVQTYGASVTLLQQLTPPKNTVALINPSSHADLTFSCTSSVNNCTDQAAGLLSCTTSTFCLREFSEMILLTLSEKQLME